jgi:hypothetical protein
MVVVRHRDDNDADSTRVGIGYQYYFLARMITMKQYYFTYIHMKE